MNQHPTSDLNWIPVIVKGISGRQTFFRIEGVHCRAVYLPDRKNLFLTAELVGHVDESVIQAVREQLTDSAIEIVTGEKLVIKYQLNTEYTDDTLRVLIVVLKTILTSNNSGIA